MNKTRILLSLSFLLLSACSTTKVNTREVASLGDVAPAEKGACIQVIKTFIGAKKVVKKKGLSDFFPSKSPYAPEKLKALSKVESVLSDKEFIVNDFSSIRKRFSTYSYSKISSDSSKEVDAVEFNTWVQMNMSKISSELSDELSFAQAFDELLPLFKKWKIENGFSFKNLAKLKKKSPEFVSAKKDVISFAADGYNSIVNKKLSNYSNYKEFLEDAANSISNFHIIEENFQGDDFFRWLSENDLLSDELFKKMKNNVQEDQTMGDFLAGNYSTFLPFSKKPLGPKKSVRQKMQDFVVGMFTKHESALKSCGDDPDCIARESRTFFEKLMGADRFKKNFSCLRQFPQARNAMYVDFVTSWAMLGIMYKSNEDEFQRFPWEIATNGLIFTPIMSEINCQASFQTRNAFGGAVNLSKQPSKTASFLRNWRRMAGVSLVSGVSLVGLGVTYNELYSSLGVPVENTGNLQEQIKLLPFMFMWSGVLGSLKNIAITNPLKYKVIPKLAGMIQTKTGIAATGVAGLTALNFGFASGAEFYESWSFNEIWRYHVLPKYLEIAGYDREGDEELNGRTTINAFDESRDIYITEYDNGVKTSVTVEKSYDDEGKEYIKVEDIDLEIPDYILEESVEGIPKVN
ncbi:hypothetical protein [Halobacteriovorax sp. HLS]|uniref:hypothetical protein n=1 Tax=Halobacteriovorax sp. HLS TaxID=2234000 RepID=UPI000FD8C0CC|nr:hypothetical protein [Halobacteriovorax sp. HLS]